MNQIKQILLDRIGSILELQCLFLKPLCKQDQTNKKYDLVLQHKKAERIRSMRENQILLTLNNIYFPSSNTDQELYEISLQICSHYDEQFASFNCIPTSKSTEKSKPEQLMSNKLNKLYSCFFQKHGFQQKSAHINKYMDKDKSMNWSPALYLGWLAEWSKKIYCELLQKEIQKTFSTRERSPKSVTNSFTLGMLENKNKRSQRNEIEKQKLEISELSQISLSNRMNIYSFFVDDLVSYYKLTGIQGVDIPYLRNIRKRAKKQEVIKTNNLNRAVNILIETSNNKQILNLINEYRNQYENKYGKVVIRKESQKKIESVKKIPQLSPIRKRPRNNTQTDESKPIPNPSKLLSPKLSQIQFMKIDEIESKIKRVKIMSHFKSTRNNLQFPGISHKKDAKYDLKWFIQDRNNSKPGKLKQEIIKTLQKRLEDRDFLKCESLQSKYKSKDEVNNSFQQIVAHEKKSRKSSFLPKYLSDYEDRRLKISKIFDLADLKSTKNAKTQGLLLL